MKKRLLKILLFIILFVPFFNVSATSHSMITISTDSFSSADTSRDYYIGYSNTHNFSKMYFHQIITDDGESYLAYCLDDGMTAPTAQGQIYSANYNWDQAFYNKTGAVLSEKQFNTLRNIMAVSLQLSGESVGDFVNYSDNTAKKGVLATQILIWEIMDGVRDDYRLSNYNSESPNTYDFVKTDPELKTIYENIVNAAWELDESNLPTSLGKTYIMHWNDGKGKYSVSGINVGLFTPSLYDGDLDVDNNEGNLTITSTEVIEEESTIQLQRIVGALYDRIRPEEIHYEPSSSSINSLHVFKFDQPTGRQKVLLGFYRGLDKGELKVKSEKGKFRITKKDTTTNKTIKGAEFKLYKCSSQTKCDTKETATIDMKNKDISDYVTIRKSGLYLIKETVVPSGYEKINDFYVTFTINDDGGVSATVDSSAKNVTKVTEGNTINLVIGNDAKYFNIKKIDGRDSKTQIKGAEFQIKKSDGTIMKFNQVSNGKYRYDSNGTITSLKSNDLSTYQVSGLPVGEYILEEKSVPYPYVLQGKQAERETKFRIDKNDFLQVYNYSTNKFIKASDVTITVKNFKTRISIIKTGLKSKIIPGVTFELYDKNKQNQIPLRYENGEYIYNSGGTPIQLVTNSNGLITINYLPEGTYYLKETSTPVDSGLVIDPNNQFTQVEVFVNRNDATPYNYRKEVRNGKGTFCFYKIDEDGNYLDSGKFKLQMYNVNTSKYEDKALIFNQDKTYTIDETSKSDIYTFSPISEGQTCFVDINAKGKYRIVEIEAPEGFVLPSVSETQAEIVINEYGYANGDALLINKKVKTGEGAQAQAELIINIQTGQNRVHYILALVTIIAIISGLIIYKKKIDKK